MVPSHAPDAQPVAAGFNAFLPDCDLALAQSFFLIPLPVPLYLIEIFITYNSLLKASNVSLSLVFFFILGHAIKRLSLISDEALDF